MFLVRAVRVSNGLFGSDSSKRTKFGPDAVHTILFRFFMGAKVDTPGTVLLAKSNMAATGVNRSVLT
jgi:hypothetical protein